MKTSLSTILPLFMALSMVAQENKRYFIEEKLEVEQITENVWMHKTHQTVEGIGSFTSNGLIFVNQFECFVFYTPPTEAYADILINWIRDSLLANVRAVIVNHFHDDCIGGLKAFHDRDIPSYATTLTQYLAIKDSAVVPTYGFEGKKILWLFDRMVILEFSGEAHTEDNIIAYIPSEKVLFGGCMVKSLRADKGNTTHANLFMWPETVKKVRKKYKSAEIVIPGHGQPGGLELLDYTIRLFSKR